MRKNLPITNRAIEFPDNIKLVSVTDLKGRITYANENFINISGYSEKELLGAAHNLVRHPDMPEMAFAEMWEKLKKGNPWVGVVKNRAKNGDHYWVSAYVAPYFENGQIIGYQSVRSKPDKIWVDRAEKLYKHIMEKGRLPSYKLNVITKSAVISTIINSLFLGMLQLYGFFDSVTGFVIALIGIIINTFITSRFSTNSLKQACLAADEVIDSQVARIVYTGRANYLGQMQLAKIVLDMRVDLILYRVNEDAKHINAVSYATNGISKISLLGVQSQKDEINKVRKTMESTANAIAEVRIDAKNIVEMSTTAAKSALTGRDSMSTMANSFANVLESLESTADILGKARNAAKEIIAATSLLTNIGKKSELLAVNSAVEAARAGEHGRGFSIVADEIRVLATTSKESAAKINTLFADLSTTIDKSIIQMQKTNELAIDSSQEAKKNSNEIAELCVHINVVETSATSIDKITKHQSDLGADITNSLANLDAVADQAIMAARQANDASEKLLSLSEGLESLLQQFNKNYQKLETKNTIVTTASEAKQKSNDSSIELF